MADTTILQAVGPFAIGDTLTAYVQPKTPQIGNPAPTSSAIDTAVVGSDGSAVFDGLTAGVTYWAGIASSVPFTHIQFRGV